MDSSSICCLSLRVPDLFQEVSLKNRKTQILSIMDDITKIDQCPKPLKSPVVLQNDKISDGLVYDIIYELITNTPRENPFSNDDSKIIINLLQLFPRIASLKDENNMLLIHHVCMMESPDIPILVTLTEVFPAGVSVYANFGNDLVLTPLLLILYKSEVIDYNIASLLVKACPRSASLDGLNGKYPLHFVLSFLFDDSVTEISPEQLRFIQLLLESSPEAMLKECCEEMNSLKLISSQPASSSSNRSVLSPSRQRSSSYGGRWQNDAANSVNYNDYSYENDDHFSNMTIFIGQEQYKVETAFCQWSPYKLVMQLQSDKSYHDKLTRLFTVALDKFTKNHFRAQWRGIKK